MSAPVRRLGPLLALAACDAAPVDEASLGEVFRALHAPVYDLYALGRDRDALHDHLASSFAGEALTREYVEHWRALERMAREETAIQVLGVEYEDVTVLDVAPAEVGVDATWRVRGVVTHQRHRHPRINRYRAVYTLAPTEEGLRIVGTRMRDLARVASRVEADAVFDDAGGSATGEGFMDPLDLFRGGLFDDPEAP